MSYSEYQYSCHGKISQFYDFRYNGEGEKIEGTDKKIDPEISWMGSSAKLADCVERGRTTLTLFLKQGVGRDHKKQHFNIERVFDSRKVKNWQ